MNLRARIWLLPACAATVFIIGCGASYLAGSRTQSVAERLRVQDYPAQEAVAHIERDVEAFKAALQAAATEGDVSRLKDLEELAAQTLRTADELGRIAQQGQRAQALRAATARYQEAGLRVIRAMLDKSDPAESIARMQAELATLDQALKGEKTATAQAVAATQEEIAHGIRQLLLMLVATCAATLVALGLASRQVITSVWRELGAEPAGLGQAMQRIADGDLYAGVSPGAAGAHGSVAATLGNMTHRLRDTVGVIRQATTFIAGAASEIAAGNQDLSHRTEQAASHLQRTASALEQVTGTVGHTAAASGQARELAGEAVSAAQRGGEIVSQVVANMDEISAASRRINDITGVIDGLAFQTNILALNAAVEAARAGEQGRGFAVVASEVRSLAQRRAQAAKEIKQLIAVSSEKVASGTRLVAGAGETMSGIVQGVQRVTTMIAEMSEATQQQSAGISEVNGAVAELDRMTQQNAALVEESAAAAAHLRAQADRLAESVAVFRLQEAPDPVDDLPLFNPPEPATA